MKWIKVSAETDAAFETSVCLSMMEGILIESGINGYEVRDCEEMREFLEANPFNWDYVDEELQSRDEKPSLVFYVSDDEYGRETLLTVETLLKQSGINSILTPENCDDEDWLHNWKKYYKPFAVGEKIIIRPSWEEFQNESERKVFVINPGHVFGTGLHQTTKLCIEAIERYVNPDTTVLDVGCGSGILSLIALLLGAKNAVALDIEPGAAQVVYENAELNNIDRQRITVHTGNIFSDEKLMQVVSEKRYSLILANIVADVCIALTPHVMGWLQDGGTVIMSGIIDERLGEVLESLHSEGFKTEVFEMDKWFCVVSHA